MIPKEPGEWMQTWTSGSAAFAPVTLGPGVDWEFLLDTQSKVMHVQPITARAAIPVAQDSALSPGVRAAMRGSKFSLQTGRVILPVDSWDEDDRLRGAAGQIGISMLKQIQVTIDFRDSLVRVDHAKQ